MITDLLPVGVIIACPLKFNSASLPKYLKCNGSEISRYWYNELYNLIGTTYGKGNGYCTFNIPKAKNYIIKVTN